MKEKNIQGEIARAERKNGKWEISFGWNMTSISKHGCVIYKDDLYEKLPLSATKVPKSKKPKEGMILVFPDSIGIHLARKGDDVIVSPGNEIPTIRIFMDLSTGSFYELLHLDIKGRFAFLRGETFIREISFPEGSDFVAEFSKMFIEVAEI